MSQSQPLDSQSEEPFPCPSPAGPVGTQEPRIATLVLMVGLPAAGKTTRAKELAAAHQALRLTPDHWMIPLFGDPMADGKRWVLEGRLISVALQAVRLGTSVVLDYGLWGRDERSALRWLARSARAACQVVYHPAFARFRRLTRWALIALTAATIIAYFALIQGQYDAVGIADKIAEVVLIVLLVVEGRRDRTAPARADADQRGQ